MIGRMNLSQLKLPKIAFACAFVSQPVSAYSNELQAAIDALVGTQFVLSEPIMENGARTGCALEYNVFLRDHLYGSGDLLKVAGSVGVLSIPTHDARKFAGLLKVSPSKLDWDAQLEAHATPSPPTRIYLTSDTLGSNLDELVRTVPNPEAGSLFGVFHANTFLRILAEGAKEKRLKIGFDQNSAERDLVMSVDFDIVATDPDGGRSRSDKQLNNFVECLKMLLRE